MLAAASNLPSACAPTGHTCVGLELVNVQDCPWDTDYWNTTAIDDDDLSFTVAALGPYDWGYQGNYSRPNPTGFWPDYYTLIEKAAGVTFTRVYYSSSDGVMAALANNSADMTEPYWTLGGTYNNRPRIEIFERSCTCVGTDSVFFTLTDTNSTNGTTTIVSSSTSSGLETWVIVILCVGSVMVVVLASTMVMIIKKERDGEPIFIKLAQEELNPTHAELSTIGSGSSSRSPSAQKPATV